LEEQQLFPLYTGTTLCRDVENRSGHPMTHIIICEVTSRSPKRGPGTASVGKRDQILKNLQQIFYSVYLESPHMDNTGLDRLFHEILVEFHCS
jgi:hypothetical protein